jgi:hypothetical protein
MAFRLSFFSSFASYAKLDTALSSMATSTN